MAAPTQQQQSYPAWLTLTTVTLPTTTETNVVYLPLTYYGPSIPLGSDWVYGGLSSPASTSSTAPSSAQPTSTSATSSTIPTSSSISSTPSSAIPSSSSVSAGSSIVPPTTFPSAASSSTGSTEQHYGLLSRGQLIGVVIGAVLALFVLIICFFSVCFRRMTRDDDDPQTQRNVGSNRKTSGSRFTALIPRRKRRTRTRFTMLTPGSGMGSTDEFDADWLMAGVAQKSIRFSHLLRLAPFPTLILARLLQGTETTVALAHRAKPAAAAPMSAAMASSLPTRPFPFPPEDRGDNPFDLPTAYRNGGNYHLLPPGAGPANGNGNGAHAYSNIAPGRRILSPSQLAMLVEEEGEREVLPRPSVEQPRASMGSHVTSGDEEAEVVVARRVAVSPPGSPAGGPSRTIAEPIQDSPRRSWIARFSWLTDPTRNSREIADDPEAGAALLFDASAPPSPGPVSPAGPRTHSKRPSTTMREFGARSGFGFFSSSNSRPNTPGSRPVSGALGSGSRPISGVGSEGTNGSSKSGGTVYTDARETLSTRGSNSRVGAGTPLDAPPLPTTGDPDATVRAETQDPLDMPAPAAFAPFSSAASMHHSGSRTSLSEASQTQTLSHQASLEQQGDAFGLDAVGKHDPDDWDNTPTTCISDGDEKAKGSLTSATSWDKAGLELGFARPASFDKLGTFGSGNREAPLLTTGNNPFMAPVFHAPPPPSFNPRSSPPAVTVPLYGSSSLSSNAPGIRIVNARPTAAAPSVANAAPHLSLDLDDAPPGADGGWRLLGGSTHSLLGSGSEVGVGVGPPGKRGTFGAQASAAQYHHTAGPSSEHGSLHSRLNQSTNSGSISSRSANSHSRDKTGSSNSNSNGHSQYPSSGSARSRAALGRPPSVEGPMSPAMSAFGAQHLAEGSSGSERAISPLPRARSPNSPLMSPWAGGLDAEWRPTYT
ncbi:hypothetical protein MKEN_00425600 [Mycena kentingensis (nom. inval.)]|nr:hypothetical protein MKEN_00425600 [Mycena kentingensis (nom. inval.)]